MGRNADAAFALDGLDQDRGRLRPDRGLDGLDIAERHLVEAGGFRTEALDIFVVAAGGDGGQRPAVEGAVESDEMESLGMAVHRMVLARGLDRPLERLGPRVGEEHVVGEARGREPFRQPFRLRDLEQVRRMPQVLRLFGQGGNEMGMGIAERGDGDAAAEIEVALALRTRQPHAVAARESEIVSGIGRKQRRRHVPLLRSAIGWMQRDRLGNALVVRTVRAAEMQNAARPGGTTRDILCKVFMRAGQIGREKAAAAAFAATRPQSPTSRPAVFCRSIPFCSRFESGTSRIAMCSVQALVENT